MWLPLFISHYRCFSFRRQGSAKEIARFSRFDNGLLITARAVGIFLFAAFTFTPDFKKQEVDERRGALRDRFRLRSSVGSLRCRHCNRCSYKVLSGSGPSSHSFCLYLPFSRLVKTRLFPRVRQDIWRLSSRTFFFIYLHFIFPLFLSPDVICEWHVDGDITRNTLRFTPYSSTLPFLRETQIVKVKTSRN